MSQVNVNQIYLLGGKKTTFFHMAAVHAGEHILEMMCQNGAKLDILDEDSKKPYDLAFLAKRVWTIFIHCINIIFSISA